MVEGRIIQSLSGYYDVDSKGTIHRCRGRGNFRKRKMTPLVGDDVEFENEYILDIKNRKNQLLRPPMANVDQGVLVFSVVEPEFHPYLLDRFLVRLEIDDVRPLICITKVDLANEDERDGVKRYAENYRALGYEVIWVSPEANDPIETLRYLLAGQVSVFAGQSGVGKSTLLNRLQSGLSLKTGKVSQQIGRGKHTTRRIRLIPVGSGFVADTPGFSSIDFRGIEAEDLSLYFPEMKNLMLECRFRGCTHISEPGCAVKAAVSSGRIEEHRYEHYKLFLDEIKSQKRRY